MGMFRNFCQMASRYAGIADFVTVYIEEAHPSDGFKYANNVVIKTHKDVDDRIEAASQLLQQNPPFPIVCDGMDDAANYAYGALYERLYVIHRGKIAYEGGRGPVFYKVYEVHEWLENYRQANKKKGEDDAEDDDAEERTQLFTKMQKLELYSGKQDVWAKLGHFLFSN